MEAIQRSIDDVHQSQLDETRKLALEMNLKKNPIFAERTKVLAEKAPADFWARVLRNHPDFRDQLMGPYDGKILDSLVSFSVNHLPDGVRLELKFAPNDFFTNDTLWYEEHETPGNDPLPKLSGIDWKPGHGPRPEDSSAAQLDAAASNPWVFPPPASKEAGQRRGREEDDGNSNPNRGPSFFSFFAPLPAPPNPDDFRAGNKNDGADGDSDDEDEGAGDVQGYEAAADDWEEEVEERREIARMLIDDVWEDPAQFLTK